MHIVWEKKLVLFLFWGPENLRSILFPQLFLGLSPPHPSTPQLVGDV